ncbi:MAG: hypothetical protein KDA87_25185 [Planctomycetales bacterium]|nr:hypothetical protein [Planctomycetales bacterium]
MSGNSIVTLVAICGVLVMPIASVAGWYFGRTASDNAYWATRRLIEILLGILVLQFVLGMLLTSPASMPPVHRWLGHLWVIAVWCVMSGCLGVALSPPFRRHGVIRMLQAATMLLLQLLSSLAAMSGYLGQGNGVLGTYGVFDQASSNRFLVLHQILFPTLCGLLLLFFRWSLRHSSESDPVLTNEFHPADLEFQPFDESNPYHPPSTE